MEKDLGVCLRAAGSIYGGANAVNIPRDTEQQLKRGSQLYSLRPLKMGPALNFLGRPQFFGASPFLSEKYIGASTKKGLRQSKNR